MEWLQILKNTDPQTFEAITNELDRQRNTLDLIPSENFTSVAVLQAIGSVLTNKYSEGYPGKRYYAGNEFIDTVEKLAIERAKTLFNVPHANVQAYSGSPANIAIYFAICKPGDVIMGQNLTDGGHLTHGWKTSITGQYFKSVPYHVKPDGYIDLEEVRKLAAENKPKIIWVGATAYTREFPFEEFSRIADETGSYLAADISHIAGLVAAGVHKSPASYVHVIMTTTHKTLRGPRGAMIMVTRKGLEKDPELADKIDKSVFPGLQGGPHDNTTAGIAVALHESMKPEFKEYSLQIVKNAKALAEELMNNGLKLVTSGTDNHMILIDLTDLGEGNGILVQETLELCGIIVNKNTIPNDPSSPFYPSGIRLGTPAITTRSMKENEMKVIGNLMSQIINEVKGHQLPSNKEKRQEYLKKFKSDMKNNQVVKNVKNSVENLCKQFPLYTNL
ncbi:MAG: serine hydroxymethyltransferase [Candidatus Aenigmarchaeota archaeon]|nr:serine hydroxymethyltransferase [Candidatus Aenigmarchaeota archaeon]